MNNNQIVLLHANVNLQIESRKIYMVFLWFMKFTFGYTLLFVYVIAAIVFWGYSLNKQAYVVYQLERKNLLQNKLKLSAETYNSELKKIEEKRIRRKKQYLGEGGTFLLITILASSIIYIGYYRQRRLGKLQQNFMLSVTHELKTPIAGIKLNMQTMERHRLDEDTQMQLIQSTIQESNRLNDLCNNILLATQLEDRKQAMYPDDIMLIDLLEQEAEEFEMRYPDIEIVRNYNERSFEFKGERTLWKLVLSNLIENARKYSLKPIHIELETKRIQDEVFLCIKDHGIGIPDEEKDHVFQKFYRIGNEDTRRSKGTGLGLYLVKKIIHLYKYDIAVKNNTPQGSIFEIRFS